MSHYSELEGCNAYEGEICLKPNRGFMLLKETAASAKIAQAVGTLIADSSLLIARNRERLL